MALSPLMDTNGQAIRLVASQRPHRAFLGTHTHSVVLGVRLIVLYRIRYIADGYHSIKRMERYVRYCSFVSHEIDKHAVLQIHAEARQP